MQNILFLCHDWGSFPFAIGLLWLSWSLTLNDLRFLPLSKALQQTPRNRWFLLNLKLSSFLGEKTNKEPQTMTFSLPHPNYQLQLRVHCLNVEYILVSVADKYQLCVYYEFTVPMKKRRSLSSSNLSASDIPRSKDVVINPLLSISSCAPFWKFSLL